MNVQTVTGHSFVVYITQEEMACRHILPCDITEDIALDLLSPVLSGGEPVRLELFPGRDDLIIFVYKFSGPPAFFSFSSFENLIDAIRVCRCDAPSSLFFYEGQYILVIRRSGIDPVLSAFSEFGDKPDHPPDYVLFLEEHAHTLIRSGAVSTLRAFFDN